MRRKTSIIIEELASKASTLSCDEDLKLITLLNETIRRLQEIENLELELSSKNLTLQRYTDLLCMNNIHLQ